MMGFRSALAVCIAVSVLALAGSGAATKAGAAPAPAGAVDVAPHRALYKLSLGQAKPNSGVTGADGTMAYEWGESCDGWTVQQHYRLRMHYEEEADVEMVSNFVGFESKDGLRYRFDERKLKNGAVDEEIRGEAKLDGIGKGGKVTFTRPKPQIMELAPGVIFPTAHTLLLIARAKEGNNFVTAKVLDGAEAENAVDVSAVIGKPHAGSVSVKSPLLERPSWRVRLAFFPADVKLEKPDYELSEQLYDNGISADMGLDYGDFLIKGVLDKLESLTKPAC